MNTEELSHLLDVILDDLSARFIINLPEEELSDVTRICFGLEQAHWFYEDFFRPQYPTLPSVNLRQFTAALFSHCPLLWPFKEQHETAFDEFMKYKIRVPVRGAIMLNSDMTQCVLVRGWKSGSGWGFPKGKIDQGEEDYDCAIREIREECGFDISELVQRNDFIEMVIKEQQVKLYIVRDVPMDTVFEPQTRKEIGKIDWFDLDELPTYNKEVERSTNATKKKYYMVAPFLGRLRGWIKRQKKAQKADTAGIAAAPEQEMEAPTALKEQVEVHPGDSSEALKLLLGIQTKPDEPVKTHIMHGSPNKHDLLAMLRGDIGETDIQSSVPTLREQEQTEPIHYAQAEPQLSQPHHLPPILQYPVQPGPLHPIRMPPLPSSSDSFYHGLPIEGLPSHHMAGGYPVPPMLWNPPGVPPYPLQGIPPQIPMQHMHFTPGQSGPFVQQMHPMPPPNLHLLQQQHMAGIPFAYPPHHQMPRDPLQPSPQSRHAGAGAHLVSPRHHKPVLASPQPIRAVPMPVAAASPTRKAVNPNAGSLLAILKPQVHQHAQHSLSHHMHHQQQQQPSQSIHYHETELPKHNAQRGERHFNDISANPSNTSPSRAAPAQAQPLNVQDLFQQSNTTPPLGEQRSEERPRGDHIQTDTSMQLTSQQQSTGRMSANAPAAAAPHVNQGSLMNLFRSTPPASIVHLIKSTEQTSLSNSVPPVAAGGQPALNASQASLLNAFKDSSAAKVNGTGHAESGPQQSTPTPGVANPNKDQLQQNHQPLPDHDQHLASLLGSLKPPIQSASLMNGSQPAALLSVFMQKPPVPAPQPQQHQQSLLALLTPSNKA